MAQITHRIRTNARAFQIWRTAEARHWDCTLGDLSDALDMPIISIANVCRSRGWLTRLRTMSTDQSPHYLAEEHFGTQAA